MRALLCGIAALLLAFAVCTAPADAKQPKKYQVTGKVVELTEDVIVIEKGDEKWEIGRTADTKVEGKLEVGAKVTIEYRMTAAGVEVKKDGDKPKDGEKPKDK